MTQDTTIIVKDDHNVLLPLLQDNLNYHISPDEAAVLQKNNELMYAVFFGGLGVLLKAGKTTVSQLSRISSTIWPILENPAIQYAIAHDALTVKRLADLTPQQVEKAIRAIPESPRKSIVAPDGKALAVILGLEGNDRQKFLDAMQAGGPEPLPAIVLPVTPSMPAPPGLNVNRGIW